MRTAAEILDEHGLAPPPAGATRYYAPCPRCSANRKPAHRKSECLGITITRDGVHFDCSHCGWKGGGYYNGHGQENDPIGATYDYQDESGAILFQKVRTTAKRFWQRQPDDAGDWINNVKNVRKVLYQLPRIVEAIGNSQTIICVEGEKDADNLCNLGIPATCSPDGAAKPGQKPKWRPEYSELLRGADVVIIPDHDPAGYAHAKATADGLRGIAQRIRMLKLAHYWPQCPVGGDVSDWLAASGDADRLWEIIAELPDWTPTDETRGDVPPPEATQPLLPLGFIDAASWQDADVPPRRWLAHNRIPMRNVCLLTGDGATGKTTIGLQLGVGVRHTGEWLGAMIDEGGAVMFVTAEEDFDEVHRRLADVLDHERLSFRDIVGFQIKSLVEEDEALLGVPDATGVIKPTPLFMRLLKEAQAKSPRLIVIEAAADVFGGNEINRGQVRQFIALLRQLARAADGAVVLIAHPSQHGLSSGSGTSGSTGWNNSVRSRLYFTAAKTESDEPDVGLRELKVMKSNYGPPGEIVRVRWHRGVFIMEKEPSNIERAAAEARIDEIFLRCLDMKTAQGIPISSKPSRSGAGAVFSKMPEAVGLNSKAVEQAQERLLCAGRIKAQPYGSPSDAKSRLVRVEAS